MNKAISINLNNQIFNLEEPAFLKLKSYLDQLAEVFADNDGAEDIINDIECRIAELFQERLHNRQVVLIDDVNEVIELMGRPEDLREVSEEPAPEKEPESKNPASPKRLFRDPDEGILGGVCIGLGHYFGIDPALIRVLFLVLLFIFGTGSLAYIILWMALPKAQSTADRLKMRGEPVTVASIEKSIRDEFERIKKKSDQFGKTAEPITRNFFNELFEALIRFFKRFVHLTGRSLGILLLLMGGFFFTFWLAVVLSGTVNIDLSESDPDAVFVSNIPALASILFEKPLHQTIFLYSLAAFFLSFVFAFWIGGLRLVLRKGLMPKWIARANGVLSTLALLGMVGSGLATLFEFSSKAKIVEPSAGIFLKANDTLTIRALEDALPQLNRTVDAGNWRFFFGEDAPDLLAGSVRINLLPADQSGNRLTVSKYARGADKQSAMAKAQTITTYAKLDGRTLWLNPYFTLRNETHWRSQKARFNLYLNENTLVRFDPSLDEIAGNIPLEDAHKDEVLSAHIWRMQNNTLACVDCSGESE